MEYKKNLYSCTDGIAKITMNYAKNLNAIDMEMAQELLQLLDECERDPEVKVVVLGSSGRAFSGGGDIGYFYEKVQAGGVINIDDLITKVGQVTLKIKKMSKMVIASVAGAAAGAGANLALSGDLVICAENVKLVQAFINLGMVPDTGGSYFLCKSIGVAKAMELCALGKPLTAADALSLGLINEVCPLEELEERTMALAKRLAVGPLVAFGCLKKQFFAVQYQDYERYLREYEFPTQHTVVASEDFKEGVCAFMEKRKPNFQGK